MFFTACSFNNSFRTIYRIFFTMLYHTTPQVSYMFDTKSDPVTALALSSIKTSCILWGGCEYSATQFVNHRTGHLFAFLKDLTASEIEYGK